MPDRPPAQRSLQDESRVMASGQQGGAETLAVTAPLVPQEHPLEPLGSQGLEMVLKPVCRGCWAGSVAASRLHCHKSSCLIRGGQAGPGPTGTHDTQATGDLVLTIHTDFHSRKALLFNRIFVAGKFCEFVC